MVLMEITLLVEEHLVVVEVFLLVDLLDPQDHKDPTVKNQVILTFNTTGLETSFADLSKSMSLLLDHQQVMNQYVHQQMQLNNMTQQAQIDALQEVTASNYQRNFDRIFANILIFDGGKMEDF